jgi:uncharacterized protein (TIGR02996 family)
VNEQDALLEAISATPDDDTPRLVYADWLDEHGEGVYASFIRLQIARARIRTKTPERDRLLKQETAAWRKLKRRWADLLTGWAISKDWFFRGFCRGTAEWVLDLGADVFLARSPGWWPRLPIKRVRLMTANQFPDELLESDYLRRLTGLRVEKNGPYEHALAEEFMVRLFSSDQFARLEELEVVPIALSRAAADAMRSAPFLDNLKRLSVMYYSLGHMGWVVLPDQRAFHKRDAPPVARGRVAAALRERLDELTANFLVVPPGETSWRAMLAAAPSAPV